MEPKTLKAVLKKHGEFLRNFPEGKRADLSYANLSGADLGAAQVLQMGPIGSRKDYLVCLKCPGKPAQVSTGCFHGSLEEFAEAIAKTHGDNEHARAYFAAVRFIKEV